MEELLERVSAALTGNIWLAPLFALLGGVLTSLMPCSLSTVPLVIGCVGGGEAKGKRAFGLSLLFALGSSITFITLGVIASAAGLLLERAEVWMHLVLALLLVLMALQMWGVINLIPAGNMYAGSRLRGGWGAFIAGLLAGVFSAHCAAPVIVALLAVVIDRGQVLFGAVLLLFFSVGHAVLAVIAGTSVGLVQKITDDPRYEKAGRVIRTVLGIVIMLVALYLLWEAISEGLLGHEHSHAAIIAEGAMKWL